MDLESNSSGNSSEWNNKLNPENLLSEERGHRKPKTISWLEFNTTSARCAREISYPSYSSPERPVDPNRLSLLYKNQSVIAARTRSNQQRHNISPMLEETEHVNVFLKS
jgi:hypothetical protein